MNRKRLDAFVERHGLSKPAIDAAFELTQAQPTTAELERFLARLLLVAGALSLGAGLVFFVAANWDALAVLGRFALVEAAFVAAVAAALWRPPPHVVGRAALLCAFIATGALLALYGQTYQTGADVYELFLSWAAVGLVIVVAGQWSVTWAAWALVLNVALLLYSGWRPESGWLFALFLGWQLRPAEILSVAMLVDLGLWLATLASRGTPVAALAPRWLGRFVLACAVGFGTLAGIVSIVDADAGNGVGVVLTLAAIVGIAVHAVRRRDDVFPLALVAASAIVLTTTAIGRHSDLDDFALFFTLALWLIVSSTLSGHLLMKAVRDWRADAVAE
jgi:uncharacterized membrane protein